MLNHFEDCVDGMRDLLLAFWVLRGVVALYQNLSM